MLEPSPSLVHSFNRLLKSAGETKNRQLRCVWGALDYGLSRWVIQAHLPAHIHAQCVDEFAGFHEERYIDKEIVNAVGQVVGHFRYDNVNPWVLVHVVRDNFYDDDDDRGYRMPAERDLSAVYNWMHEFNTVEEQLAAVRAEQAKYDQANKDERNKCLAEDFVKAKYIWDDPGKGRPFEDMSGVASMPGTEIDK